MEPLERALSILTEQFGEIDNVKLLLEGGEMTKSEVVEEILAIAEGIQAGKFVPRASFPERPLEGVRIG